MSAPVMRLDFASTRKRVGSGAMALLATGVVSLALTLAMYQRYSGQAEGLELRLAALSGGPAEAQESGDEAGKAMADAAAAIEELATPWSKLLVDLEAAAADSDKTVALLAIEPDRESHKVQIMAESRTLPAAVAFTERLQKSEALVYPLMDSHEIQDKDPYRPVRFQITASWRLGT